MSTDKNKYNHIVKDLEPGPGNPRNSEGAFIGSPDGRIMFIYSKFNGGIGNDDDPAGLAQICSGDGGETWTDPGSVITAAEDNAQNIMSVSLIRMQNGDIGLIYFIRYGFDNGKAYMRRSPDEGQTWSKAVCCVPAEGYYVTNNDRIIRLKSGRLILPTGYHRTFTKKVAGSSKASDSRSMAIYFYSDDDGITWDESNICAINSRHTKSGLQEPGAIELENGMLYGWARTDMGFQYEMLSGDGGKTWTTPEPSVFTSPCSPMSIKRDPVSGNLLAVWNSVPRYQTLVIKGVSDRNPLVYAVSRNDGLTWGKPVVLEDDALSGFCYTAIHFAGDCLLLAYCAGGPADKGCLNRLRVRKMSNPCL